MGISDRMKKKSAAILLDTKNSKATAEQAAEHSSVVSHQAKAPLTAPGGMAVFRQQMIKHDEIVHDLEEQLKVWVEATPAKKLDPKSIGSSKWANRNEQSFSGPSWDAFKEEISSAGGNIQPIKVRGVIRDNTLPHSYEIVFGHRRHRACLELGLDVFALVESISDRELFEQMDRENRQRADLTAYEQGEMYRRALDEGLYPSLRKMVESLGVHLGNASVALKIAKLPHQVLDAFESRLDIQFRWAGPLADAIERNQGSVLSLVETIQALRGEGVVVKSSEVFKRLTAEAGPNSSHFYEPVTVKGTGGKTGRIGFNSNKNTFEISLSGLDAGKLKTVEAAVKALLS